MSKLFYDGSFGSAPTQVEMDAALEDAAQDIRVSVTNVQVV